MLTESWFCCLSVCLCTAGSRTSTRSTRRTGRTRTASCACGGLTRRTGATPPFPLALPLPFPLPFPCPCIGPPTALALAFHCPFPALPLPLHWPSTALSVPFHRLSLTFRCLSTAASWCYSDDTVWLFNLATGTFYHEDEDWYCQKDEISGAIVRCNPPHPRRDETAASQRTPCLSLAFHCLALTFHGFALSFHSLALTFHDTTCRAFDSMIEARHSATRRNFWSSLVAVWRRNGGGGVLWRARVGLLVAAPPAADDVALCVQGNGRSEPIDRHDALRACRQNLPPTSMLSFRNGHRRSGCGC